MWLFPKMGVPLVIIHFSSTLHFGVPPFMETPICQMGSRSTTWPNPMVNQHVSYEIAKNCGFFA